MKKNHCFIICEYDCYFKQTNLELELYTEINHNFKNKSLIHSSSLHSTLIPLPSYIHPYKSNSIDIAKNGFHYPNTKGFQTQFNRGDRSRSDPIDNEPSQIQIDMSEVCEEQSKSQQDSPMKGKCNSGEMY